MGRFSITVVMVLAIPALAAAQHHGGGFASAPMSAGRSAPMISRAGSAPPRASARMQSGTQSAARTGSQVMRTRNGGRIIHRNNGNFGSNGFNDNGFNGNGFNGNGFNGNGFNGNGFSDVPGLGFDYPHLAAVGGNRRHHGGRFDGGFPFGFGGFLLNPPVLLDEGVPADSQAAQDQPAQDQVAQDDAPDAAPTPEQYAQRRSRARRPPSEPQAESAPAPVPDVEQYVFVRRDGSLVFAVAYAWDNGTLRYVTPDGFRRSMGRDALDINATQQFNEQRGINFRAPA
jgi:hypothetical protein